MVSSLPITLSALPELLTSPPVSASLQTPAPSQLPQDVWLGQRLFPSLSLVDSLPEQDEDGGKFLPCIF
jgi:hypothetical protein